MRFRASIYVDVFVDSEGEKALCEAREAVREACRELRTNIGNVTIQDAYTGGIVPYGELQERMGEL